MSDLEPIGPQEALDMWLDRLEATRADETLTSYRYRLKPFVSWCESEGIDNLNDLSSRDIFRFDSVRRSEGLLVSTLNTQLGTLKLFIRFCERIDAVEGGLPAKVEVPSVDLAERVNDELLSAERAEAIRKRLHRYERASRRQAMFELLWHTGCRLGGLHALDPTIAFSSRTTSSGFATRTTSTRTSSSTSANAKARTSSRSIRRERPKSALPVASRRTSRCGSVSTPVPRAGSPPIGTGTRPTTSWYAV